MKTRGTASTHMDAVAAAAESEAVKHIAKSQGGPRKPDGHQPLRRTASAREKFDHTTDALAGAVEAVIRRQPRRCGWFTCTCLRTFGASSSRGFVALNREFDEDERNNEVRLAERLAHADIIASARAWQAPRDEEERMKVVRKFLYRESHAVAALAAAVSSLLTLSARPFTPARQEPRRYAHEEAAGLRVQGVLARLAAV